MLKIEKIVINALAYKQNSSGIGVMIRDLFGAFSEKTALPCQIVVTKDAPELAVGKTGALVRIDCTYADAFHRIGFQTFKLGRNYGKNALLLFTDSKMPLFLPKSCIAIPLITDLAVFRMPEVYQTSRVLWWRLQYGFVKRRANFFLAISEFTKREMMTLLRIPPERIFVVPCACNGKLKRAGENEICLLREQYQLTKPFVLFVGNTNPRKNLQRLIRAFDKAKQRGLSHQLVIAGEQGWKFDRESVLKDVACKDAVHFIGFVPDEDLCALYSAADVFAFPTLYEGFGIPVLEAQSCGTPVLTSACSSLPEVGGDSAVYVDPHSEDSICDGLLRILNDAPLREELIEKGYENVKRFSWQRSAELLEEIIERNVER